MDGHGERSPKFQHGMTTTDQRRDQRGRGPSDKIFEKPHLPSRNSGRPNDSRWIGLPKFEFILTNARTHRGRGGGAG